MLVFNEVLSTLSFPVEGPAQCHENPHKHMTPLLRCAASLDVTDVKDVWIHQVTYNSVGVQIQTSEMCSITE